MTIRNTKRMILLAIALLVLVTLLDVFVTLRRPGHSIDYFEMVMPLLFVAVFAGTWRRLSKLEAEHGPDYVQPSPPYARKMLIGAGIVAAVLGAIAGYLIVAR